MTSIYPSYDYYGISSSDWWLGREGGSPSYPSAFRTVGAVCLGGPVYAKVVGGSARYSFLLWVRFLECQPPQCLGSQN